MTHGLCMLSVHAHPDDEASKGAATVAKYHAQGVWCVLVCCTGGEEGDILNPAMDRPEVREHLAHVRSEELALAASIIGYDEVAMLGYADSGMPGSPANEREGSFARAPLAEATSRLVSVVRRTRPQVMIAYPAHQSMYPHPDHLRVHEVALAAFRAAGDPDAFPDAGPAWQPLKLYYTLWSKRRMVAIRDEFARRGLDLPWDSEHFTRMVEAPQEEVTAEVDVTGWGYLRREALLAHATQVDPESPFWFGLPSQVEDALGSPDEYHLAVNLTGSERPENDLFAGIAEPAEL
ncbi:MAG TPA: mycothiol conjugate amidase Mca [Acidimicrobiales bacterium]|nr:mycothiol conjugate amidase Mca [Acidimicrobiales bacterium]